MFSVIGHPVLPLRELVHEDNATMMVDARATTTNNFFMVCLGFKIYFATLRKGKKFKLNGC